MKPGRPAKPKSKERDAFSHFARIAFGVLAMGFVLLLANDVHRGVIAGKRGSVPATRDSDPGLFWLLVAAKVFCVAFFAFGALRNSSSNRKEP